MASVILQRDHWKYVSFLSCTGEQSQLQSWLSMKKRVGKIALRLVRAYFATSLLDITQHWPHLSHCRLIPLGLGVHIKKIKKINLFLPKKTENEFNNTTMTSFLFSMMDHKFLLLPHGKLEWGTILIVGSYKVCLDYVVRLCGRSQLTASCLSGSVWDGWNSWPLDSPRIVELPSWEKADTWGDLIWGEKPVSRTRAVQDG